MIGRRPGIIATSWAGNGGLGSRNILTKSTISGHDVAMIPGLLPIFLHSCEIKSGSGLGTRIVSSYSPSLKWYIPKNFICYTATAQLATFQTDLDFRQAGLGLPVQHRIKLNICNCYSNQVVQKCFLELTKWCAPDKPSGMDHSKKA